MRQTFLLLVLWISSLFLPSTLETKQIKEKKEAPHRLKEFKSDHCECTIIFYDELGKEELGRVYKCTDGGIHLIYYTEEGLQKIKNEIDRTLGYE